MRQADSDADMSATPIRFERSRAAYDRNGRGVLRRSVLTAGGLVALSGLLAACGSAAKSTGTTSTSTTKAATSLLPPPLPPGSPTGEFALRVLPGIEHGALVLAAVRINGQGPYPFLVDTGSGFTDISPQLSSQLHLAAASPLAGQSSVGSCGSSGSKSGGGGKPAPLASTPRVKIVHWDVGGVQLPATVAASAPAIAGFPAIDGRIGSDLLSKLSPLTIDYHTSRGTLGTTHKAAGSTTPGRQVPVKVARLPGAEVLVAAKTTIGGHDYPFLVDTGDGASIVAPATAKAQNLRVVQKGLLVAGAICNTKTDAVALSSWHLGSVALPAEDLRVDSVLGSQSGLGGLIGGNVLSSFGSFTLDYTHQTLTLGS